MLDSDLIFHLNIDTSHAVFGPAESAEETRRGKVSQARRAETARILRRIADNLESDLVDTFYSTIWASDEISEPNDIGRVAFKRRNY